MISSEDIQEVKNDIILLITVFVVTDFVLHMVKNKPLFQTEWVNSSLGVILGFIVYRFFTDKITKSLTNSNNININNAIADVITWSTVFVVSNIFVSYINNVQPNFNTKWFIEHGAIIAGYVVYSLFVNSAITEMDLEYKALIGTLIKVSMGTIMSYYALNVPINETTLLPLGATLSGFTVYHLVVKKIME